MDFLGRLIAQEITQELGASGPLLKDLKSCGNTETAQQFAKRT